MTDDLMIPDLPDFPLGPDGHDPIWDEIRWFGEGCAMYYDRHGEPITLRQWMRGVENYGYRFVRRTMIDDDEVVTAWSGMDLGFDPFGKGAPRIFGTIMIHHGETTTFHDEETDCTEAEALATHNKRVLELRKESDGRTDRP